jgi:hypothetical protein
MTNGYRYPNSREKTCLGPTPLPQSCEPPNGLKLVGSYLARFLILVHYFYVLDCFCSFCFDFDYFLLFLDEFGMIVSVLDCFCSFCFDFDYFLLFLDEFGMIVSVLDCFCSFCFDFDYFLLFLDLFWSKKCKMS